MPNESERWQAPRRLAPRTRGAASFWLRRNAVLTLAAAFVGFYCFFLLRTNLWARGFAASQRQEAEERRARTEELRTTKGDGTAMRETVAVLKAMGVLGDKKIKEQAEELAEEAAEDGRERLEEGGEGATGEEVGGDDERAAQRAARKEGVPRPADALFTEEKAEEVAEELAEEAVEDGRDRLIDGAEGEKEEVGGEEVHHDTAVDSQETKAPNLRVGEDTVAYEKDIPLEDAGEVPLVGATPDPATTTTSAPVTSPSGKAGGEKVEDHKWTAFGDLPLAGGDTNPEEMPGVGTAERDADALPAVRRQAAELRGEELDTLVSAGLSTAFISRRFDESRLLLESGADATPPLSFEERHDTVSGYNGILAYLQNYTTPAGSDEKLFLFFTCSDEQGKQYDWRAGCTEAREKVYDVFAKSPSSNRLVTIYAGTKKDWKGGNVFTDDKDLRLKAIPTVMEWEGGAPGAKRATSGVLVDKSVMYESFLRYLFRNVDKHDKLLAKPEVQTKEIVTLKGYEQFRAYMDAYARSSDPFPLFMILVSGRQQSNNRLWCPWCRQVEMPVEYGFFAYAPPKSKLVVVETYDLYKQWKNPLNDFKQDPQLAVKGVPWFYRVYPGPPGEPLTYQRVKQRLYVQEALQWVFEGSL